jgi:hypothetical protein
MKSKISPILKTLKDLIPQNFSILVEEYEFKLIKNSIWDDWFYDATYQKENLYIRIDANTHPRDYPMYFNIILGEGKIEWPDTDWNSVALWHIAKQIEPNIKINEYQLEDDQQYLEKLIHKAKDDLVKYNGGFLEGTLELFFRVRKIMNKNREPYKIHTSNKDGTYSTHDDKESLKLKKKYS